MRMMVFPFSVTVNGSGKMLDAAQGVYARSLARALADRLSDPPRFAAELAALTADGLLDGENGLRGMGWVVASRPWTLSEACRIGLPPGTEYLLHGAAELTDRIRLRLFVVDSPERKLAADHVVVRPRGELFAALDEAASAIARAAGTELPARAWPTQNVEAYIAYLRGRDVSAAYEASVRVMDPHRSFDSYLEALRLDADFEEAQDRLLALALDFALAGNGPLAAARAACEKLLFLQPLAFKAHFALAEIALRERDAARAEAQLAQGLELRPDWAAAYERMGAALSRQRRFGEAIPWFEKALAARSDDADALQGLGAALAACGNLKQAVLAFRAALFHGPDSLDLRRGLANALAALGRGAEAREERARARRLEGRRFGLDLLHEAWEWLNGGTRAGA